MDLYIVVMIVWVALSCIAAIAARRVVIDAVDLSDRISLLCGIIHYNNLYMAGSTYCSRNGIGEDRSRST